MAYTWGRKKKNMSTGIGVTFKSFDCLPFLKLESFIAEPKLISGGLHSSIWKPAISTIGGLTGQLLCHILEIVFCCEHGVLFVGSIVHIHTYSTTSEKRNEPRELSIQLKRATCGLKSQVSDASAESCFVELRWRSCSYPLLFSFSSPSYEVFYQFLLRNMKQPTQEGIACLRA